MTKYKIQNTKYKRDILLLALSACNPPLDQAHLTGYISRSGAMRPPLDVQYAVTRKYKRELVGNLKTGRGPDDSTG